jgi:hypothetical protein
MVDSATDMFIQERKVLSFAKNTLGSILTGIWKTASEMMISKKIIQ